MIVGDPSTGYSFKATLAALNTLIDSSTSIGDLNGVVITSPTNGQALVYDGTNWVNQSISVPVTSVFGRTGAVVATEGDYSLDLLSDVTLTTPSSNQVLQYNGTAWVNATLTDNGITSLNGLTALSQTFATGSSGTDFAISSTTSTHTFNLPTASAVNRGALSSADWSTFNSKVGGSGTSGQVAYWTGTSSQSGSNNLFWDNANGRLGIGTNAPSVTYTQRQSQGIFARYEITNANANQNAANFDVYANVLATPDFLGRTAFKFEGGINNASRQYQIYVADLSSPKIVVNGAGNVIINGIVDGGQRLQVTGDVLFKGSGNTSGTTALTVQNSDANAILQILNNGYLRLGTQGTSAFRIYPSSVASSGDVDINGLFLTLNSRVTTTETSTNAGFVHINGTIATATSGIQTILSIQKGFAPTSGTAAYNNLSITSTINQTGGANGITRGLYVNPTLTAAADWRSIEWSNNSGWGLYGAGTANNYLQGNLSIGTTTTTGSYAVRANGSIYAQTNLRFDSQLRDNRDNGIISQSASGVTSNRVLTIGNATYLSLVVDNANLLLGSTVDGGQKLQVTGQAIISSTSSRQLVVSYPGGAEMRLTASATANNFSIFDVNGYGLTHGTSWSGINASQTNIRMWTQATNTLIFSLGGQDLNPTVARTRTIIEPVTSSSTLFSPTSGNAIDYVFRTIGNSRFSPTSGNATYTFMSIVPEYNTTGTYSGTVTGLIYNPTLTSLTGATHIAIQTVSGNVLFGTTSGSVGVGTSTINASAILQADSTTKGMLPPRMTNAQMVAIGTPASGLMVYDTTNNKLNVYDGTNWVAVH
jgi:hypothetical protein